MTDAVWITPGYPWPDEPATNIFYQTQARAVSRIGGAVTVVCPTPWAPWPLPRLRPKWRSYAGAPRQQDDGQVSILRPRYPNLPGEPKWACPERFIEGAAWGLRSAWEKAQVVHGHASVTGLAASRLARRANLPLVLTFHGSDMNVWPDQHPERLADLRSAVREAHAVIAVSAALVRRIRQVTDVTAIHLPIGVDHRWLAAHSMPLPEARQLLGLPQDRLIVLFVGNLKSTKGVRELADAVLELGDPYLGVFVGGGSEAGYGTADQSGQRLLDYRGPQSHESVVRYLSAADVLVLPSYGEGLPTVLVEAGSVGVPVVASAVGGVPELLGEDRGAILADVSVASIVNALAHFRADRGGAEQGAERLRRHVIDFYDVDRNASRLLEYYRSVAMGDRLSGNMQDQTKG